MGHQAFISYSSLLEKVMQASEGNFLFLKGLPDSTEEQDYFRFLDQIHI